MATLALSAAGGAAGSAIGGSFMGITSTVIGEFAGSIVGSAVDRALFGSDATQSETSLKELNLTNSAEGAAVYRLFGRYRLSGNLIWTTHFREETSTEEVGGGKGGGSQEVTDRTYFLSFAVSFCEGNSRTSIGRIWADGELLDTGDIEYRFYPGGEEQEPDPKIAAVEGSAPAYRGIAYIVFEELNISKFGNRIPQITAEIIKPIQDEEAEVMENLLQSFNLIPASGEATYCTKPQVKEDGFGNSEPINIHLNSESTDLELSIESLKKNVPNTGHMNLVVAWFGDDLRIGECVVEPRVEVVEGQGIIPDDWSVGGLTRSDANEVSKDSQGRPIYGGTPSDESIRQSILHLESQEIAISFYPFLLMDVPPDNDKPDPRTGQPQGAYPWRGRISASTDTTDAVTQDVRSFFSTFREMIFHYAELLVGIADDMNDPTFIKNFYVGTEMRGTTSLRDGSNNFPGVDEFVGLVRDVKSYFAANGMSHIEVSYAADWSEYHSFKADGEIFWNMDPLWAVTDFVAIDNYLPISDWREGTLHADYGEGDDEYGNPKAVTIYDKEYLRGQIEGGELYHYYYETEEDREAQRRTPVSDWRYAQKDIRSWWERPHPGGSWSGRDKRIVFSEYGCPAVDKGPNQPNVFYDPKSSESFFPYFSNGQRDDAVQRAYLEAMITYWRDNSPEGMIDTSEMFAWTWDVRPYPAFPYRTDIWSDGDNWDRGHWLNGRVGAFPLGKVIEEICGWSGIGPERLDVRDLAGSNSIVRGYLIDSVMSSRSAIEPLASAYFFDGFESEGLIKFRLRGSTIFKDYSVDDFVLSEKYEVVRGQETEIPSSMEISFMDEEKDYKVGSVNANRQSVSSQRKGSKQYPLIMTQSRALEVAQIGIQEQLMTREELSVSLPATEISVDPGDGIRIEGKEFRVGEVDKSGSLQLSAATQDNSIYNAVISGYRQASSQTITAFGTSVVHFMDLPLATGEEPRPWAPRVAAYQNPYPNAVNVYENTGNDLILLSSLQNRSQMGILAAPLPVGPSQIIDEGTVLQVDWNDPDYDIVGKTEDRVRRGANVLAVRTPSGRWELLKFIDTYFQGGRRWTLRRLIRGQLGTEAVMEECPEGSPVVLINRDSLGILEIGRSRANSEIDYRYGPSSYETGSEFYKNTSHRGESAGQLPYAVADIRCMRRNGEVHVLWKRQTRFGGEDLEISEVPLNEEIEQYELDFYDAKGNLLRSERVNEPRYVYDSAPDYFSVEIYQMSRSVGRGRRARGEYRR